MKRDKKGYILEVDVEYPKYLHKNHNELPFLAKRMKIGKVGNLVQNLRNKKTYVVHIRNLNQELKHDLKLKKVHRVIRLQQSYRSKPYIMLDTKLKTASRNEFEKEFFKLMNNNVFGRDYENIVNHKDMKLVTNREKHDKCVMRPNFKNGYPFSKELFAVEMGKVR